MIKLSFALRYYVHDRMTRYAAWRNVRVILSDASVPGEVRGGRAVTAAASPALNPFLPPRSASPWVQGEHKIIKFIRHQRTQEGYDPNQRHIIHGLDADLIMLALATHEPHFTVLRERVFDDKRKSRPQPHDPVLGASVGGSGGDAGQADPATLARIPTFMKKPLQFLHIHILREYLEAEFKVRASEPRGAVRPTNANTPPPHRRRSPWRPPYPSPSTSSPSLMTSCSCASSSATTSSPTSPRSTSARAQSAFSSTSTSASCPPSAATSPKQAVRRRTLQHRPSPSAGLR